MRTSSSRSSGDRRSGPSSGIPFSYFAHLAERAGAPMSPTRSRGADAGQHRYWARTLSEFRSATEDSGQPVAREGELRFVPHMEGVTFNPPERRFLWTESVHREDFRMRADESLRRPRRPRRRVRLQRKSPARRSTGEYQGRPAGVGLAPGGDARAPVPSNLCLAIRIATRPLSKSSNRMPRRPAIDICATSSSLRAGEVWDQRLLEMIKQADVFQLFWSWNALVAACAGRVAAGARAQPPSLHQAGLLGRAAARAGRSCRPLSCDACIFSVSIPKLGPK